MLHLLIRPGQEELDAFTSFHDSREPYETIGFNQMKDTLEDVWQFAGWDWCHDCITEGQGDVIGWLPFENAAPAFATSVHAAQRSLTQDNRNELRSGKPEGFREAELVDEGNEPDIGTELNGEVGGYNHNVAPLPSEATTASSGDLLPKVLAPSVDVEGEIERVVQSVNEWDDRT
jgi:hypothetical protein